MYCSSQQQQLQRRQCLAFNALIFVQFYLSRVNYGLFMDAMEERQTTFRLLTWARFYRVKSFFLPLARRKF